MDTVRPHGWGATRAGSMLHYFGLTRDGSEGYRRDGSPLAMCHNALLAGEGELTKEPQSGQKLCESCARYLARCPKKQAAKVGAPAEQPAVPLKEYQKREVLRGKMTGVVVTLQHEHRDFPGFWIGIYEKDCGQAGFQPRELLVNGDQLGPVRPY